MKGSVSNIMAVIAALMILAVCILAIFGAKFWNVKNILDSKLAAERVANDMAFMQNSGNVIRIYELTTPVSLLITPEEVITLSPPSCIVDISSCKRTAKKHHVPSGNVLTGEIKEATKFCAVKSEKTNNMVKVCDAREIGCCEV